LWRHLKSKQLEGLKFRRQQSIGNYIVDFVSFEKRVIIELYGGQHTNKTEKKKDCIRDEWFKNQGFRVLRFWNNDVFKNMNGILGVIIESCLNHPPLTPPIKGGGINQG
jgi:very-short-patch-repair endonuclease